MTITDYNLTPAQRTGLQSAITPPSAMAITNEIDRAKVNLKHVLDRLIIQFEAKPPFVTAYEAARKVIHTGFRQEPKKKTKTATGTSPVSCPPSPTDWRVSRQSTEDSSYLHPNHTAHLNSSVIPLQ